MRGRHRVATRLAELWCAAALSCVRPGGEQPGAPNGAPAKVQPAASLDGGDGVTLSLVRRRNYALSFGPYALEVDPLDGGRIVRFSLEGNSVVQTHEESPEAYGSSFWTSPQSAWTWPPPLELDKGAWQVRPDQGTVLVLESAKNRALGISVRQRITADPTHESFLLEFAIKNEDDSARRFAPWQNTRCRPGGLTFFPSSGATYPLSAFHLEPQGGVIWFRHDPKAGAQGKLFADGTEGWLAHVDGELLFIKIFPDVPREEQAPKEADVEIYVDSHGRFVEVEQQGPYVEIAAGDTSTWRVRWILCKLPASLRAEVGSGALVDFVRSVVAKRGG